MTKPISDALQVGMKLRLSNGSELPFLGAATLSQLENVMDLYDRFTKCGTIQACYIKSNEDSKQAFEELLFIATGEKMPKEELLSKVTVDDSRQVYEYINRFCGFIPLITGTEEKEV